MKIGKYAALLVVALLALSASAAEHRVEVLNDGPPTDEISKEIAATLNSTGVRVIRGTSRTLCEIWLCRQWPVKADFQPTDEVIYPFDVGQLIGVARFVNKGADFRDQDVNKGVYTIRYAQQPIDGDHVGTSPTRDFLLLVAAENDPSADTMDYESLAERSSEAAESTHPALFSLQRIPSEAKASPSMRHHAENDWWIVRMQGKTVLSGEAGDQVLELVVVGQAAE